MIKVKKVDEVKKKGREQIVVIDGEEYTSDTHDFAVQRLAFLIEEGSLIPTGFAVSQKLNRTKSCEDKLHEGYHRLIDDVVLPVRFLFPVDPYKPGTKERLAFDLEENEHYATLLGVREPWNDVQQEEIEDEFGLDDSVSQTSHSMMEDHNVSSDVLKSPVIGDSMDDLGVYSENE